MNPSNGTERQHREARPLPHDVRDRRGRGRATARVRRAREHVVEREKPVAAFVHGLDEARHFGLVAERDAQPSHGRVQAVLEIHERAVRPEPRGTAPPVLTTSPGRSSSARQDPERLFLQGDPDAALAQLARPQVHLEGAEPDDVRRRRSGCLHAFHD